jgi:chaperonin GroEL
VGAATETELKDKKLRYEDALNSVRSALEMGVVPGGGACMTYLQRIEPQLLEACENEDERIGASILVKSLSAPCMQIAYNAGVEGGVVWEKTRNKEFGFGYNAATCEYGDLFEMGVIDPAKVTINAIENSASVASLVLTTEALITEVPVHLTAAQEQQQYDQMGGGDYM